MTLIAFSNFLFLMCIYFYFSKMSAEYHSHFFPLLGLGFILSYLKYVTRNFFFLDFRLCDLVYHCPSVFQSICAEECVEVCACVTPFCANTMPGVVM